jgi:hypothetical protein
MRRHILKILIIFCLILSGCVNNKNYKKLIKLKTTYEKWNNDKPELLSMEKFDKKGNLIEELAFSLEGDGLLAVTKIFYNSFNNETERIIVDFSIINSSYNLKFTNKQAYTTRILKDYDSCKNIIKEIKIRTDSNDTITSYYDYSTKNRLKRITTYGKHDKGRYSDYFYDNEKLIKICSYDSSGKFERLTDSFTYTKYGKIAYKYYSGGFNRILYFNNNELLMRDSDQIQKSAFIYDNKGQLVTIKRHYYDLNNNSDFILPPPRKLEKDPVLKYSYQYEFY